MRFKPINPEVFYIEDSIVEVRRKDIEFLINEASKNTRQRVRLCAHPSTHDSLHEMLIVHARDTYVRPHKHPNKSESVHVVEGLVDIVIFDDIGDITKIIKMGDYTSGHNFYYRLSQPSFHTLIIKSDYLIFHETTNGPFNRSDTVFAQWSPEENDTQARKEFLQEQMIKIDDFVS